MLNRLNWERFVSSISIHVTKPLESFNVMLIFAFITTVSGTPGESEKISHF